MRPRCSVFVATSLDGFIARPDGRIDWLEAQNARVPPGEDCGYGAFVAGVDAIVMGRHTFEQVLGFERWPYDRPVVVMSRRGVAVPAELADRVTVADEAPAALVGRLGAAGLRHLYVDGGQTIRAFLAAGLIDELTITTVPVLIGEGRPLFGAPMVDLGVELVASRAYPFGFVQSTWRVTSNAQRPA
ncbi:MAG: dihydrofolate reductase [Rubrivivax sp.]|nr:dihydrofolate reductase [Rubrivivax sp.]